MNKRNVLLLMAMWLLCSCGECEASVVQAGWSIPIGIQILAYIGVAAIVVMVFGFILVMGGSPRNED